MGSATSELSLDLMSSFVPKTITGFLREVSEISDGGERLSKMEEYVKCLEEERRKIDAFKRELPLCMVLLNDVVEVMKEEVLQCRTANARPVLEEFMPIKSKFDEDGGVKKEKDCRDKMSWMSSAQLWSDNSNDSSNKKNKAVDGKEIVEGEDRTDTPFPGGKYKTSGGAFLPFKGFSGGFPVRKEEKEGVAISDLSLLSPGIKNSALESCGGGSSKNGNRNMQTSSPNVQSNMHSQQNQQPPRKARRCWSPELHRRFVNALQQLGGAQVATPKQIRELMKVDGLTNDEVKSHLQKYRLHTRRLPTSGAASTNQQVMVLGGLWVPNDQYQSSKSSTSQSGSPQGPLQLAGTSRGLSVTGGDSAEDDGKSESYSWKSTRKSEEDESTVADV